jgi:hypothetical protein
LTGSATSPFGLGLSIRAATWHYESYDFQAGDHVARKGRARRFREARKLKQGFDDGLFREGSGTLADVDDDGAAADDDWDDEDDAGDGWDDETHDQRDEDWDPLKD